jgi:transcriptional regulator with XRE-family HTH domain
MSGPTHSHALGLAIRRRRRARDITQEALAASAGVSSNHLGEIERGLRDPRMSTVVRLVEALDLSPHELSVFWEEALGDGDPWPGR